MLIVAEWINASRKQIARAISDPTDKPLYAMLKAATSIVSKDDLYMDYIRAFRKGRLE